MAGTATLTANQGSETSSPPKWEELLGSQNWEGLVEPELNLSLRKFILHCGNLCQATYDAFDSNTISPNCGNSRYSKDSFFSDVVLENASNFQVVAFLYATSGLNDENLFIHSQGRHPWDLQSNWIGYVAITTDNFSRSIGRRQVYVAWRGTTTFSEWISNLVGAFKLDPVKPLLIASTFSPARHDEPQVHRGWLSIYTSAKVDSKYVKLSARKQLHSVIQDIKNKYKDEKMSVVVTGHSLGGALAILSAFDLAENKVAGDDVLVSAFVFGCPMVGNKLFKDLVNAHANLKIFHTHNIKDKVPDLPGLPDLPDLHFNPYTHISTAELMIDTGLSPFLKQMSLNLLELEGYWHNLEANLHVVAWWNGPGKDFDKTPKVKRSLLLVNKSSGPLIDKLKVPENWWIEKTNIGMKYDESKGEWLRIH